MQEDEIKKNINKCSRCALCLQNCPIYQKKKDENNTARGLICKLSGYEKNILVENEIKKDLKICLNCSKCKENCPSKVNTTLVFAYKNAKFSPSIISQRLFLMVKLLPIKILYFLNIFKKKLKKKTIKSNVLYFKGCVAKAQHKITYLDKIFSSSDFLCCGLPYLSSGDIKNYNKAKIRNINLIKNASKVVFDCASCKRAVSEYEELDENEIKKLVFFSDFLSEKNLKLNKNSKYRNKTVVFHKPCHMDKDDFKKIELFLANLEGINYKKLENPDQCCGFGGSYFIYHPIVAFKILLKKAFEIKKSKADLILTACPSCTIGLRFGQIISLNFKKTLELRDFVDCELTI